MHAAGHGIAVAWGATLLVAAAACNDPRPIDTTPVSPLAEEICESSADWLPNTPDVDQYLPLPHPASECPFYRGGWQNFLIATQPIDAAGTPAFAAYPTIASVFQPKVPYPANRSFLGDIKQAGGREIAIDQNGNSLYYGIHVNQQYKDFIANNHLMTADELRAYPGDPLKKTLLFPPGVVEFKTAWQVVEGDAASIAQQTANFISMTSTVPTLSQDPVSRRIIEDRTHPRTVVVRLLAIHVVFTLTGHPEFIWASFEHSTGAPDTRAADLKRDVAPTISGENPTQADPNNLMNTTVVSPDDHLLYKGGTAANSGNVAIEETKLNLVGQSFPNQQTSIYRMFPAAKSNTTEPDAAITSLNHNVEALFAQKGSSLNPADKRGHYRLVGAQWMDKPRFFKVDSPLQNDASSPFLVDHQERQGMMIVNVPAISQDQLGAAIVADGSDSEFSILAGEDRLSSTAMESFTQGPSSFNNCFTCHNTQAITANGIPLNRDKAGTPVKLIDPGLLNVSHVISQFLLEEYEAAHAQ
ncbi:MAG TPA: hypothetical protein VGL59_22530 [Polyangia bacterium]